MKRIFSLLFLLVFALPISIKAYECSNADRERLQKLANNVSYILEEQDDGTFNATFTGLSEELKIVNSLNYTGYYNTTTNIIGETVITGLVKNKTYSFEINGYYLCNNKQLRIFTISIPNENPYYNLPVCDNAKSYSLCQKWVNIDISYEEFEKKVSEYITNNSNKIDNNISDDDITKTFDFITLYEKYYWPTFIGMIIILCLLIFLWVKENKKNRL